MADVEGKLTPSESILLQPDIELDLKRVDREASFVEGQIVNIPNLGVYSVDPIRLLVSDVSPAGGEERVPIPLYTATAINIAATDSPLRIALKPFRATGQQGKEDMLEKEAFIREIQTLQHLYAFTTSGIRVPRPIGVLEIDEGANAGSYIVDTYFGDYDLEEFIKPELVNDPEYQRRVFLLFSEMVRQASLIHALGGIVIGDIKPSNVRVTQDGLGYTDFGTAFIIGDSPSNYLPVRGTVGYMPLEQYLAKQASTVRADIFALGVTLYEMLGGQVPTEEEIYDVSKESPLDGEAFENFASKFPALAILIKKATYRDITKRYASAESLLEDFEKKTSTRRP